MEPLDGQKVELAFKRKSYELRSHISLSVILEQQDPAAVARIIGFQKALTKGLIFSQVPGEGLYVYPPHTVHFTLINFLPPYSFKNTAELQAVKRMAEVADMFGVGDFEGKTSGLFVDIKGEKIEIKDVYKRSPLESVSLRGFFSKNLLEQAERFASLFPKRWDLPEVKAQSSDGKNKDHFPVNIFRIFKDLSEKEKKIIAERIWQIDSELRKKPLIFKLSNLSLVVSDDYLSNPNPSVLEWQAD